MYSKVKRVIKTFVPSKILNPLIEARRIRIQSNYYKKYELNNPGNYYSITAFDYYKCIFVHIPKSAGTSVSKTLFGNYGSAHKTIRDYQNIYPEKTFNKYFKFTFVRNPYDRVRSAFYFLQSGGMNEYDLAWSKKYLSKVNSFEDFVINTLNEEVMYSWYHFKPQVYFLKDKKGNLGVDFIGYYENLNEDFNKVTHHLKIPQKELEYKNKTKKTLVTKHYTPAMQKKIFELYKNDFELLGYNYLPEKSL